MINMDPIKKDKSQIKRERIRAVTSKILGNFKREEIEGPLLCGDTISMTDGNETVSGRVNFNPNSLKVEMVSPIRFDSVPISYATNQRSFFSRVVRNITVDGTEPFKASPYCIQTAWKILEEMYIDYLILNGMKDELARKWDAFNMECERMLSEREEYNSSIDRMIAPLIKEKSELKRRFKAGEMKEMEYKRQRSTFVASISELTNKKRTGPVFHEYFNEEISLCMYIRFSPELIEKILSPLQ